MFGTVVFYNPDRAYGFIRQAERLADVFFHVTEYSGDPDALQNGAHVEFELGERKGKIVARNVRTLGADDDRA